MKSIKPLHMRHRQWRVSQYLVMCSMVFFFAKSYGQTKGADLFDEYCYDCHSIGEGVMTGPDLMGVELRQSNEWLLKFIKSSKTMIAANDPTSVVVFNKFDKSKMPDTDLPEGDIQEILRYIANQNKNLPSVSIQSSKQKLTSNGKPVSGKAVQQLQKIIDDIESNNKKQDDRLTEIEQKVDLLLKQQQDAVIANLSSDQIKKGESLFNGGIPFSNGAQNCVSCHNVTESDTLNWNPSAFDIAKRLSAKDSKSKIEVLNSPVSDKMRSVTGGKKLTDDEVIYIIGYLNKVLSTGTVVQKAFPVRSVSFVIVLILVLGLLSDYLFLHKIKLRIVHYVIVPVGTAYLLYALYIDASNVGINQDYAPIQPIKFSHKVHAKDNKINCLFCHNSPEYSQVSGIPSTNVCMNCHNKVKKGTNSGEFEIAKVIESYKAKKPIEWVKVHNLPDYVHFSHAEHVGNAKLDCISCHGDVKEMDVMKQESRLSMGWCVQCHRKTEVKINNEFYSNHKKLKGLLETGKIDKVTANQVGANECQKCHY